MATVGTVLILSLLLFVLAFCQVYVLTAAPELAKLRHTVEWLAGVAVSQIWLFIRRALRLERANRKRG